MTDTELDPPPVPAPTTAYTVSVRILAGCWIGPQLYAAGDTLPLPASTAEMIRDQYSPPLLEII